MVVVLDWQHLHLLRTFRNASSQTPLQTFWARNAGAGAVGWGQWGGEWGGDEHVAACAILLSILVSLQVTHKHVIHVL